MPQLLQGDTVLKKWEYLFLEIDRDYGGFLKQAGGWKVRAMNGVEQPDWKEGLDLHEYCNQLGAEGWESVSATHSPMHNEAMTIQATNYQIVMKRTNN